MPDSLTIEPEDVITRFAVKKKNNYARIKDNTVKQTAFSLDKDGTVSTYKTTGLSHADIYEIGEHYISEARKPIIGRVIINASHIPEVNNILGVNLILDPDNNPLRHVSIKDWPEDKSLQLLIRKELATKAEYEDRV